MRLLHVASGNMFGGVESMLVALARRAYETPDVHVAHALCFEGRLADDLRAAGAEVEVVGPVRVSHPLSVLRSRNRLRSIAPVGDFDAIILHSSWLNALFGGAARDVAAQVVVWMHGPASGRHWTERLARRHQPDLVIANSRFTAGSAPVLYPTVPVDVVYCAVEDQGLKWSSSRHMVRAELGVGAETCVVACMSRLDPMKGHLPLLHALARVQSARPWQLWMTSGADTRAEREYLDAVTAAIDALRLGDRVRLLGARRDVPRLLAGADVYCQPNVEPEPFGITFIEAMYAGLPVVGAAHGGTMEIVDESTGFLVPPGDVEALARALVALVEDDSRRAGLGANGPARARALSDPGVQMLALRRTLALGAGVAC